MSAGTIVGYITRPNGSPISGAEIWISRAGEAAFGKELEIETAGNTGAMDEPAAKTDSRGYFQLAFTCGEADNIAQVVGIGGKLNVSVAARKGVRKNSKRGVASESGFQVTGYLVTAPLKSDA